MLTHTRIRAAYEGRALGSVLARGALDHLRGRGLRVVPQCPFMHDWIERNPDCADLVDLDPDAQVRSSI